MYNEITDDFIVKTLSYYENRTEEIKNQILQSYKSLKQYDDAMTSVLYPNPAVHDIEIYNSHEIKDISNVFERYQQLEIDRVRDTYQFMRDITEEQETMNRIMCAFEALEEKEKDILKCIYMTNPRQKINDAVNELGKKYAYSEASIFRWRKNALKSIRKIYDSELTQSEIYALRGGSNKSDCLINNKYR